MTLNHNFAIALLLLGSQLSIGSADLHSLDRLRAKVAVEPVSKVAPFQLAGEYMNPPMELGGQLSGDNLYLFPDGAYIYAEWADIMPLTIYDKGTWTYADGFVELKSDPEITWKVESLERKYLLVRRASRPNEILLVGAERVAYFEENAGDDPEVMLLIVSKMREKKIRQQESAKLKAKLMRESWRPEHFREAPGK